MKMEDWVWLLCILGISIAGFCFGYFVVTPFLLELVGVLK